MWCFSSRVVLIRFNQWCLDNVGGDQNGDNE